MPSEIGWTDVEDMPEICDPDVIMPFVWTNGHLRTHDLTYFRGDNAYVWQVRGGNFNMIGYALATYYVLFIDSHRFLNSLTEDNAFSNFTYDIAGHTVSRDLLDSIIELDFLDRHLGLLNRRAVTILDIGAGYGRLAHRATAVVPGLTEYFCTDAIPHSTFLCEFYLRFRRATQKTQVVALGTNGACGWTGVDLSWLVGAASPGICNCRHPGRNRCRALVDTGCAPQNDGSVL